MKINESTNRYTLESLDSSLGGLDFKMFSASGRKIRCSSLRPGMRIHTCANFTWTIAPNSEALKRVELRSGNVSMIEMYHNLAYNKDLKVLPPSIWYRIKKLFSR